MLLLFEGACVGTGGSLRVTFLPTNKVEIFEQVSKTLPPFLFLSLSLSLLKLSSTKKKKQNKNVAVLLAIATAASCNPLSASPQQRAATLCWPCHSSKL
jgi:hypothetical protein